MTYWIVGEEKNKKLLTDLGIKLTRYLKRYGQWENVEITEGQLQSLNKYWGTFFWGRCGETIQDVQEKRKG